MVLRPGVMSGTMGEKGPVRSFARLLVRELPVSGFLPREAVMTPEQQVLVQSSFAKVVPIADVAANLFYEDLFQRNPKLRPLFKEDMAEQRQKLMAMLGTAVANLGNWEKIAAAVQALGRRHVDYGVKPEIRDRGHRCGAVVSGVIPAPRPGPWSPARSPPPRRRR